MNAEAANLSADRPALHAHDTARSYAAQLARWCEYVEFAIDNGPERIDTLLELAESIETAWLAACDRVAA